MEYHSWKNKRNQILFHSKEEFEKKNIFYLNYSYAFDSYLLLLDFN